METSLAILQVVLPGNLCLLVDKGRMGKHQLGLTTGGAADQQAFHWANRLCGNQRDLACLEILAGGFEAVSLHPLMFAVTGAEATLKLDGKPAQMWRSHQVPEGTRIELDVPKTGLRNYLAVQSGLIANPVFGSVSTVTREKIGGLLGDGRPLQPGDSCLGFPFRSDECWRLPDDYHPKYPENLTVRVVEGYQSAHFSGMQRLDFYHNEFTVSNQSDRMGLRLQGTGIRPDISTLQSEGICLGAIQFPPDGQPIVMLRDRQTIGGYPKIGSVISLDCDKLAQVRPGDKISFTPIDMLDAHNLIHLHQARVNRVKLVPC